jgi:hypothetical protein
MSRPLNMNREEHDVRVLDAAERGTGGEGRIEWALQLFDSLSKPQFGKHNIPPNVPPPAVGL